MSGLFSLDKVKISYGKNEIVHGVSMDIAKGEFCALLGLNGSGKTTILHACCGFLPMEGSCIAADTECKGLNEKKRARLISFIPQICSLQGGRTALDVVLMGFNSQLGLLESPSSVHKRAGTCRHGAAELRGARRKGLWRFKSGPAADSDTCPVHCAGFPRDAHPWQYAGYMRIHILKN